MLRPIWGAPRRPDRLLQKVELQSYSVLVYSTHFRLIRSHDKTSVGYVDIPNRPARTLEDTQMDFVNAMRSMAVFLAEDSTTEEDGSFTKMLVMRVAFRNLVAAAIDCVDKAVDAA